MTETNSKIIDWWWIRHVPTGLTGQFCGALDVDPPLDDIAIQRVRRFLPAAENWLTSPLIRCRKTADALVTKAARTSKISIHAAFSEQNFGEWEGLSYDDPAVRDCRKFWAQPADMAPPGGESFSDLTIRVQREIENLQSTLSGPVVCVAHAGTIRAALALALSIAPATALNFQIDPLSITRLTWLANEQGGGDWRICWVNKSIDELRN